MKRIDLIYLMLIWLLLICKRAAQSSLVERTKHANGTNKHHGTRGLDARRKRRKADARPNPTPDLLYPNDISEHNPELPLIPESLRREFEPRREFIRQSGLFPQRELLPGSLLPTPKIIKPLDFEAPPPDLEKRPFIGQGLIEPPLTHGLHRHLPLFEGQRQLLRPFGRHRHFMPTLDAPRHIYPPLARSRQGQLFASLGENRHLLSPLEEPRNLFQDQGHYYAPPSLYRNLDDPSIFTNGGHHRNIFSPEANHEEFLPAGAVQRHSDYLSPEQRAILFAGAGQPLFMKHQPYDRPLPNVGSLGDIANLPFGSIGDEKPESFHRDPDPYNSNPGQAEDINELKALLSALGGRKKPKKTWVTDVNVYNKKKKMDDIASLFGADDEDDDYNDNNNNNNIDACSRRPCRNSGVCTVKEDGNYKCLCTKHFKGKHCTARNRCFPDPCVHGKCTETTLGFECACVLGYQGTRCSVKNRCIPNPCQNAGSCNQSPAGYVCTCVQGYQGHSCGKKRSSCDPDPCMNNGHCLVDGLNNNFQCVCQEGFVGSICERSASSPFGLQSNSLGAPSSNPLLYGSKQLGNQNGMANQYGMMNAVGKSNIALPSMPGMSGIPGMPGMSGIPGMSGMPGGGCSNNLCKNNGICIPDTSQITGFRCQCVNNDFRGALCDESTCNCQNGGFCEGTGVQARCICRSGYGGNMCDKHTQCNEDTCMHGGICIEEVSGYKCKCNEGYRGERCEDVNTCNPNPCLHAGTCKDLGDFFQCECTENYKGKHCEDYNFCFPSPCKNGGTCFSYEGGFQCDCPPGFTGKNCEKELFCLSQPCRNGGQCTETDVSYKCTCAQGFIGKLCEVHDFCWTNPCRNGGTCVNGPDAFSCNCPERFKGETCEILNRCFDGPCKNGGECSMQPSGDYTCDCQIGFSGTTCEHPDECQPNPCKNSGECANTPGGFTCHCKVGFRGVTCEDPDPCHPNPCSYGTCSEINGGFVCNCTLGFRGPICEEIDRCAPSPCQHGGSCREIVGGVGYVCDCPVGYKGQICDLKDLCNPNPCNHEGVCQEAQGAHGFTCQCSKGWKGPRCEDVDPCLPNPCEHNSVCTSEDNHPGFLCNCTVGFKGTTCTDIDLCTPNPCRFGTHCIQTDKESYECVKNVCSPNPCHHDGRCIVVNDDAYECACPKGWRGKTCDDQDQCFPNPCLHDGKCIEDSSAPQNFRCNCLDSYKGKFCEDTITKELQVSDYCASQPCLAGAACINADNTFTCRCPIGFSGPICEESVCHPNPCQNGGTCLPYYGIALCKCKKENTGAHCSGKRHMHILVAKATPRLSQNSGYMIVPHKPAHHVGSPPDIHAVRAVAHAEIPISPAPATKIEPKVKKQEIGDYGYSSAPKFFPKDECKHCDGNALCENSHCICKEKFVGDGLDCWPETEGDRKWSCDPNPCQNGGTCKVGRGRCVCRLGFTGQVCQNHCPPVVHLSFDNDRDATVLDESGNGNSATLANGAAIIYEGGKCDSGASLLGGDIIFDGQRFWPKPVEAVTMAVWIKLDTNKGIQSIFDTVGDKFSNHHEGQYHLEIDNGKVRWFHRNEKHEVVFSETSQALVKDGVWTHVAGTYDSFKRIAKTYVNGDLVAKATGLGYLSQDWTKKAGIGKHEHPYGNRLLRGMVDEFYIFNCALPRLEILVLMHHCKLYFGANKHLPYIPDKSDLDKVSPGSPVYPKVTAPESPGSPLTKLNVQVSRLDLIKSAPKVNPSNKKSSTPANKWAYKVVDELHDTGVAKAVITKPPYQPKYQQILSRYHPVKPLKSAKLDHASDHASPELMLSRFSQPHAPPPAHGHALALKNGVNQKIEQSIASYKQAAPASHVTTYQDQDIYSALRSYVARQPVRSSLIHPPNNQMNFKKLTHSLPSSTIQRAINRIAALKSYLSHAPGVRISDIRNNYHNLPWSRPQTASMLTAQRAAIINAHKITSLNHPLNIQRSMQQSNGFQSFPTNYFTAPVSPAFPQVNGPPQIPTSMHAIAHSALPVSMYRQPSVNQRKDLYSLAQYTSIPNSVNARNAQMAAKRQQYKPKSVPNQLSTNYRYSLVARAQEQQRKLSQKTPMYQISGQKKLTLAKLPVIPFSRSSPNPFAQLPQNNRRNYQNNPQQLNIVNKKMWENPWAAYAYTQAKLQARKRIPAQQQNHQYQAADSHAQTSTNADTTTGAKMPGQKGAGYNFGYGYGYGSGNENKGGGYGKGWGGGGPGVNDAGKHQPPNYQNNPSFKYGFGQGMGQGGKGVPQQSQGNPNPPTQNFYNQRMARLSSMLTSAPKPSLKKVIPSGPSIMNFNNIYKRRPVNNPFTLPNMYASSPAYQVKYFTTNMNMDPMQTRNAKALQDEIISNAIADVLKGYHGQ